MSTSLRITAEEYDRMIANGAFVGIDRRIELIRGELRQMSPAGPVHEDYIDYLNRWSISSTTPDQCVVRVQSSIDLGDSRPEPDIAWLRGGRYAARRPRAEDVLLLIEVADSSLPTDMVEKTRLYAEAEIAEYWVVDIPARCIHVFCEAVSGDYRSTRRVGIEESLSPACDPDAQLRLNELFISS